jgi:hypothetical protein
VKLLLLGCTAHVESGVCWCVLADGSALCLDAALYCGKCVCVRACVRACSITSRAVGGVLQALWPTRLGRMSSVWPACALTGRMAVPALLHMSWRTRNRAHHHAIIGTNRWSRRVAMVGRPLLLLVAAGRSSLPSAFVGKWTVGVHMRPERCVAA